VTLLFRAAPGAAFAFRDAAARHSTASTGYTDSLP
jgi:hypothetical protein